MTVEKIKEFLYEINRCHGLTYAQFDEKNIPNHVVKELLKDHPIFIGMINPDEWVIRIYNNNLCDLSASIGWDRITSDSLPVNLLNEYEIIKEYYGDKIAKRSGVKLINHIDEGIKVLEAIDASRFAKQAYCIHPIFQGDIDLTLNYLTARKYEPVALVLVMEYRSVANEYLSSRSITSSSDIRISPLKDVNDMLIADKVQNRKDFELYHKGSHPRSKELDKYFKLWMERLEVSEKDYQKFLKLF